MSARYLAVYVFAVVFDIILTTARRSGPVVGSHASWCRRRRNSSNDDIEGSGDRDSAELCSWTKHQSLVRSICDLTNVSGGDWEDLDGNRCDFESDERTMIGVPANDISSTYTPSRDGLAAELPYIRQGSSLVCLKYSDDVRNSRMVYHHACPASLNP